MFLFGSQRLVILRGPEHRSKAGLARAIAGGLPGRSAVVHFSDLHRRWIVTPAKDNAFELEVCYRLLKLVVMTYLREGYNVVVDAPFVDADADGEVRVREREALDMTRLAGAFRGVRPAVITLLSGRHAPEAGRLASALEHSIIDDEIRIDGEGGNVETFAVELLERLSAI